MSPSPRDQESEKQLLVAGSVTSLLADMTGHPLAQHQRRVLLKSIQKEGGLLLVLDHPVSSTSHRGGLIPP